MVNLQSLCAVLAVFCLLLAVICLIGFGVDWLAYSHSTNNAAANNTLDYGRLQAALAIFVMGMLFLVLWFLQEIPFQRARARNSRPIPPTIDGSVTTDTEEEPTPKQ